MYSTSEVTKCILAIILPYESLTLRSLPSLCFYPPILILYQFTDFEVMEGLTGSWCEVESATTSYRREALTTALPDILYTMAKFTISDLY